MMNYDNIQNVCCEIVNPLNRMDTRYKIQRVVLSVDGQSSIGGNALETQFPPRNCISNAFLVFQVRTG